MKPLTTMNNVDKGKLLATLFPEKVQGVLDSLTAAYALLTENEEAMRVDWDNPLLPFDFWYRQAAEVAGLAKRHSKPIVKSSTLFAGQLFNGYHALFTIDCIVRQAQSLPPLPENIRYALGVRLLFDNYTVTP